MANSNRFFRIIVVGGIGLAGPPLTSACGSDSDSDSGTTGAADASADGSPREGADVGTDGRFPSEGPMMLPDAGDASKPKVDSGDASDGAAVDAADAADGDSA